MYPSSVEPHRHNPALGVCDTTTHSTARVRRRTPDKRWQRLSLAALLLMMFGCGSGDDDALVCDASRKIVGGSTAARGSAPWMATLLSVDGTDDESLTSARAFCGGSLFDAEQGLILTAAHCVSAYWATDECVEAGCLRDEERLDTFEGQVTHLGPMPTTHLRVALGAHAISELEERDLFEVTEIFIHPGWDFRNIEGLPNDIALLRVRGLPCNAPALRVHDDVDIDALAGTVARARGFGVTADRGRLPDALQEVDVAILARDECDRQLAEGARDERLGTPAHGICAGSAEGDRNVCNGDSGGPLTIQGPHGGPELVGITSWGLRCEGAGHPAVYTHAPSYLGWLEACAAAPSACEALPAATYGDPSCLSVPLLRAPLCGPKNELAPELLVL